MHNLSEIRKEIYQYNFKTAVSVYNVDLKNWRRNPYTFLKSIFYIEMSAILVFVLLKTRIHPNTVTLIYALCGILGGILLSIPNNLTIFLAIFIFFSKGILDWSDGPLARMTNRTSVKGEVLDSWGALIGSLGFQLGLGFYVAIHSGDIIYFYLLAIILALRAGNIMNYTYQHFAGELVNSSRENKIGLKPKIYENTLQHEQKIGKILRRLMNFIRDFFDDRARSVDFICLFILIEILFPGFFVTWLAVWALAFKYLSIFLGGIFLMLRRNWIENTRNSIFK
ncbi:MAG: CDP-alcohol phosphatidyltransferase family protein [Caldisericia bacterium]|nr:CDP-alcohol phosphatidyltransferase family protein [Caldisericia bacterium]